MTNPPPSQIEEGRAAALKVLQHNARGEFEGLPRTAGKGYPEPYTRDLMIAMLGVAATGDPQLIAAWRATLEALARNQSRHGHIPSLAHDPNNLGASDTTPLFLVGLGIFRKLTGDSHFLEESVAAAFRWMIYQSPDDSTMIAQQPTSDWRDEQWVLGYGLYVNALYYWALTLFDKSEDAARLRALMNHLEVIDGSYDPDRRDGFAMLDRPYYAMWTYKCEGSERFDLLGNSLAILSGIASKSRAQEMIVWVENQCQDLRSQGSLSIDLPPCLIPVMLPSDPDWRQRYETYNEPHHYHNGGIWPFIGGFYVAALVAADCLPKAREALEALTAAVKLTRDPRHSFGFNEWLLPQGPVPKGQDWQTWSAAMYLYAEECVRTGRTPFFDREH
ncbi:amylo-alpha-1,6-glucosidase [bacterium]|jgi:hypothetical protein|nr:amylo-alpha-1,6-glucosidase [bacterium]MDF1788958.1 glycoside hydrolase 100 family protein [Verrucomicrobiales bacterium]